MGYLIGLVELSWADYFAGAEVGFERSKHLLVLSLRAEVVERKVDIAVFVLNGDGDKRFSIARGVIAVDADVVVVLHALSDCCDLLGDLHIIVVAFHISWVLGVRLN